MKIIGIVVLVIVGIVVNIVSVSSEMDKAHVAEENMSLAFLFIPALLLPWVVFVGFAIRNMFSLESK